MGRGRRWALGLGAAALLAAGGLFAWTCTNPDLRGTLPAYFVAPGPSPAELAGYRGAVTEAVAAGRSVEALYAGRDAWDEVIAALELKPGDVVADVGAGTGRLEVALLERRVPFRRLYAIEMHPPTLEFLRWTLSAARLPQSDRVVPVQSDTGGLKLPQGSVDVGILLNTPIYLEEAGSPPEWAATDRAAMRDLRDAVRAGGRLHVFERTDKLASLGGEPCAALAATLAKHGFAPVATERVRLDWAGPLFRRHCHVTMERAGGAPAAKPPPSATSDASAVEAAALRYTTSRAPADGRQARRLAAEAIARDPAYTYLHHLDAWAARVGGDTAAESAALAAAGPDTEGWYRWFFTRDEARTPAYLTCHQVHLCLEREGRPIPGWLLRDGAPGGPATCGGVEVQPGACPADYSLFERLALRSRGTDRLAQWRTDGAAVSDAAFAERVGIRAGMRVADIGSGMDWFALRFARIVGPSGKVYAVEIDPYAPPLTAFLAEHHGIPQLRGVLSEPGDLTLPAASIDVAWICDVLKVFWREDRPGGGREVAAFLDSVARAVAPGGGLVLAEKPDAPGTPDAVAMDDLAGLVAAHGFVHEETLPEYLPGRHVMRFRREGAP